MTPYGELEKRQGATAGLALACDFKGQQYNKIVGGPYRTFWRYVQVTETTHCKKATQCSEQKEKSHSFGIEVDVGISIDAAKIFTGLDASIGYTEEWTTGEASQCVAGTDEIVCVWAVSQYKNFDVTISGSACSGKAPVHQISIPVDQDKADGNGYVCRVQKSECQHEGAVVDLGGPP